MELKDLIKAAQTAVVDQKKLDELRGRLDEADKQFQRQVLANASIEFLSRTYNF